MDLCAYTAFLQASQAFCTMTSPKTVYDQNSDRDKLNFLVALLRFALPLAPQIKCMCNTPNIEEILKRAGVLFWKKTKKAGKSQQNN